MGGDKCFGVATQRCRCQIATIIYVFCGRKRTSDYFLFTCAINMSYEHTVTLAYAMKATKSVEINTYTSQFLFVLTYLLRSYVRRYEFCVCATFTVPVQWQL